MSRPADDFIAPPCPDDIAILYQDAHLLLINKPSGLLSLSGKNPLNWDSVHHRLIQQFPSATLLHRLDFGTSGIMVSALDKDVNRHIMQQFQARTVAKTYTAILAGHVADDHGTIDAPIAKDSANFPYQKICSQTGKPAQSQFQVLERLHNPARTRVAFTPLTGRTHQLRIHSRELGHAILGCDLYAKPEVTAMAPRLMLHATTIEFTHPITGLPLQGNSPCPF